LRRTSKLQPCQGKKNPCRVAAKFSGQQKKNLEGSSDFIHCPCLKSGAMELEQIGLKPLYFFGQVK